MVVETRVLTWRRGFKSLQALAAHGFLLSFTLLVALKLDQAVSYSWWIVFSPLWLFHLVAARGRFSLPAPTMPHDRYWAPWHAVMATPLLVAFELLLCIFLECSNVVNLKIVFVPLMIFELAILVDNVRMCKALLPGDEEDNVSDEVIWETLPKPGLQCGIITGIALLGLNFHGFLHCCNPVHASKAMWRCSSFGLVGFIYKFLWYNPMIHRHSLIRESSSSSLTIRYLDWGRGVVVSSDEDRHQVRVCNLQDIGGHIMKVPLIIFQILLFMRLEGTPRSSSYIPCLALFSPLFLLQGVGFIFAAYRSMEKILILLFGAPTSVRYLDLRSKARELLGFMHHGSRLLGWWSIDEGSQEEQAKLYYSGASGYDTFTPESVKKMTKSKLVDEIWRLQAALNQQTEVTKFSRQEHEKILNEKILCRICFDEDIDMVLLPCRHHILCSTCCEKCNRCPICRESIEERLPVNDVW
ncbi:uncharacterized protein LOC111023869 isoform X2 [Momordica charantia]|uniref:Uncharacterized protein LOC111023869 isoform X2 n=1 Tax=Momordica charantia TaxID=3673 RepID=A0A6J1DTJ9_MOMCH|nr:uncharacterized protein LOC111023869 isoform X2 [Momordica charantia]